MVLLCIQNDQSMPDPKVVARLASSNVSGSLCRYLKIDSTEGVPDGVDTPTQPSGALGVEHMLTKQENYRDPEVLAYARLAQRLALVPGTCEEVDE